ncbi:LysE/ArgO family amino acid transporter [Microbulbifer variabilis]|uniref:LysE/ArgO family amino acid transporter n=1 Tax=Microbulbifer variabilis TaxID=266805 RepID=A0ABY4VEJ2_9GAMM|nr:LysE/ArgO family amino acid transporter [Microbulbifer variabilis]USD22542.1 LysE/ArgO family amino acid transporter [Microbulbifer variabilis]
MTTGGNVISGLLLAPLTKGFITTISLIMAIGAQNAYLLTQSIRRQYHYSIAALCVLMDIVLITSGVYLVSHLAQAEGNWMVWLTWLGVAFLIGYGAMAFRSAFTNKGLEDKKEWVKSRRSALITAVALTLLNPHAYVDTVVLIGSVGAQYAGEGTLFFVIGACSASVLWFALLSVGGSMMQPLFKNPKTWRVLDVLVGIMMWSIAASLLWAQ